MMSCDWDHQYCLGCDKQTDGRAYCSQECRLADYERSLPTSTVGSPALDPQPGTSGAAAAAAAAVLHDAACALFLSPACDFLGLPTPSSAGAAPTRPPSIPVGWALPAAAAPHVPGGGSGLHRVPASSSYTSLVLPAPDLAPLPENTAKELKAYASLFEQARTQRRRSY